jgi:hypothetical protein
MGNLLNPGHKSDTPWPGALAVREEQGKKTVIKFAEKT